MGTICSDLVVVELGAGSTAGAKTGMFLADNGARVIKVEPPTGDRLRQAMPSAWLVLNRGKESFVADLRTEDGRRTVRELIGGADVVIDAFEAGQAEAWALDYETLRSANPGLLYVSIKGFGSVGPYAHLKGYDAVVLAKAGRFHKGDFGFRPGPVFSGALLPSNGAAQMATASLLAALVVRDRTGHGQRIESTLFQGLNPLDYFFSYHFQLVQKEAAAAVARGEAPLTEAPAIAGAGATRFFVTACTSDGRWITFSTQLPHQARALMEVLELNELVDDVRFAQMPSFPTADDAAAWESAVWERVHERPLGVWVQRGLENDDLPFEPMLSSEEALDHPQVRHNGHVVTVVDPDVGPIDEIGPIGNFAKTPSVIAKSAPALGDHGPLPARSPQVASGTLPAHPLSGITILEFGYFYAMPYGVTMAAALGARVIKIEDLNGDPMRWSFGLAEWGAAKTTEGKECVAVDLRTEAGRKIVHELVIRSDVFIQGFRPGVDARLGLDRETLTTLNPSLVYVHGAGYGPDGPMAHRPIYAGTANAMSGAAFRQAGQWLDPEWCSTMGVEELRAIVAPRINGLGEGDASAALGVLTALLFSIRHQQRTGEGQFVATSMLNGNVLGYSEDFVRYVGKVPVPLADEDQLGLAATYRLYETADGWVFLAATTEDEWRRLVTVVDAPELADGVFGSADGRRENDVKLATILENVLLERTALTWELELTAAGVGCAAVGQGAPTVTCTDETLQQMGLVAEIDHPLFGRLLRYGPPGAFSATPARVAPGRLFAQDTASVLAELGYPEAAIAQLAEDGVIRLADPIRLPSRD